MPVSYNPKDLAAYLYMAYFGRVGDIAGVTYWQSELTYDALKAAASPSYHGPATFRDAAMGFADQTESQQKYALFDKIAKHQAPTNLDIATFLDTVYKDLYDRGIDKAGNEYWTGIIKDRLLIPDATMKAQQIGAILADIIGGTQGNDVAVIANKVSAYDHYTDLMVKAHVTDTAPSVAILADVDGSAESLALANARSEQVWLGTYEIASSVATVAEGNAVTFNLLTTHVIPGTFLDYTIAATGDAGASQSGHVLIDATGKASVTVIVPTNNVSGDSGTLSMSLVNGKAVASTVAVTDSTPTYGISSSASIVNEGQVATFTLNTTNLAAGTRIAYTIDGTGGAAGLSTSGTATVDSSGHAVVSVPVPANAVVNDNGTLTMSLVNGQAHAAVTVHDTTVAPTYAITASSLSLNEGLVETFTLTTTGVAAGTLVEYRIVGDGGVAGLSTSGTATIDSSGHATVSIPVPSNTVLSDGGHLTMSLLNNLATPVQVTVNDVTPVPTYSSAATLGLFPVSDANEGQTVLFIVQTAHVAAGTQIRYALVGTNDAAGLTDTGYVTIDSNGYAAVTVKVPANATVGDSGHLTFIVAAPNVPAITLNIHDMTTYSLAAAASTINEGGVATFVLTTGGVPAGTAVAYKITGTADAAGLATSGTAIVDDNGYATVSVPVPTNTTTGDSGHLTMSLLNGAVTPVTVTVTDVTPVPTYSIAASSLSLNEGLVETFTLTTTGVAAGTLVEYRILGEGGVAALSTSGTATIDSSGHATVSIPVPSNYVVGDSGHLTMSLLNGLATPVQVSVNDVTVVPTYEIIRSAGTVTEGQTEIFTLNTTGLPAGSRLEYTITGTGGKEGLSTSGTATIDANGHATVSVVVPNNSVVGDGGTLTMALVNGHATSSAVTVTDVTPVPTYSLSASAATVDEGNTVNFLLTTTGVAANTAFAYTIDGTNDAFGLSQTGTLTVDQSGHAFVTVHVPANATMDDAGSLTFSVAGTARPSVVVSVNDMTSYSLAHLGDAVNEGGTATFLLTTTGVPTGTQVAYHITGSNDAAGVATSGSMTIDSSGHGTVSIAVPANAIVGDDGALTMTLVNGYGASTINVIDTTTYEIKASADDVYEGQAETFTLVTNGVVAGAELSYIITGDGDAAGVQQHGIATVDATGRAQVAVTLPTNYMGGDSGTLTITFPGLLDGEGNARSHMVNVLDATPDTLDLTVGNDVFDGVHLVRGTLRTQIFTGASPTLNLSDSVTNVDILALTDNYGDGSDIMPSGVTLDNIAHITLNTAGNAGQLNNLLGNDHIYFDTTHINPTYTGAEGNAGVALQSVDVVSQGDRADYVRAAYWTDVSVTHQHIANSGTPNGNVFNDGVNVIGGHDVTVVSSGNGDVVVGSHSAGSTPDYHYTSWGPSWYGEVPTGDVSVTQHGDANTYVFGGVNIDVTTYNHGNINVGVGENNDAWYEPSGNVTAYAYDGNVKVWGGAHPQYNSLTEQLDSTLVYVDAIGTIEIGTSDGYHSPEGDIFVTNHRGMDTSSAISVYGWQTAAPITIYGGDNVTVNANTSGVIRIGGVDNSNRGDSAPQGNVDVNQHSTGTVYVLGGTDVTVKSGYPAGDFNSATGWGRDDNNAGGDIWVGINGAEGAARLPSGNVSATEYGNGMTTILGGDTIDVVSNGTGDVNVGITGGEGGVVGKPDGDVSVNAKSGNITIVGGKDITIGAAIGSRADRFIRPWNGAGTGSVTLGLDQEYGGPSGNIDVTVASGSGMITIYGGHDIKLDTAGSGGVYVENGGHGTADVGTINIHDHATGGNITLTGGTTVTVDIDNTVYAGNVTIGAVKVDVDGDTGVHGDAALNPSDNITFTSVSTHGAGNIDTILGGKDVTVEVSGDTVYVGAVGAGNYATGTITITQHGDGDVVALGGVDVTVTSEGHGDVTIGTTEDGVDFVLPDGNVTVQAHYGDVVIMGGKAVSVGVMNTGATDLSGGSAALLANAYALTHVTTQNGSGGITIGDTTGNHSPSGDVNVQQGESTKAVTIFGGDKVTVISATSGGITIGDAAYGVVASGDIVVSHLNDYGVVSVVGGDNVRVFSVDFGDVVIGIQGSDFYGPAGDVVVNAYLGDVTIMGGDNITVGDQIFPGGSPGGHGSVTIGDEDPGHAPTGTVTVNQPGSLGYVHINGGTDVTVHAHNSGGIVIGSAEFDVLPSGVVSVNQAGNGDVIVVGGASVTVDDTGTGAVTVGRRDGSYAFPSGSVTVDANSGEITIVGGTSVDVGQNHAGTGSVYIGEDNSFGRGPSGAVTVDQAAGSGAIEIYGGTDVTVTTAGTGGVTIEAGGHGQDPVLAGAVSLTDTGSGDISITGGTTVDVTITNVNFTGNTTIGYEDSDSDAISDAAALATDNITFTSDSTKGNTDTIYGGVDVTVDVVNDNVIIGDDNTDNLGPTGNVDVTIAGGEGYLHVYGGHDITVDTGGTGGVTIEDGGHGPSPVAVGAISLTDTGSGDISITGGTTVDVTITNVDFTGNTTIGYEDSDSDAISDAAALATDNITFTSDSTKGNTDTIYGGVDVTVDVVNDTVIIGEDDNNIGPSGDVTVTVAGGEGFLAIFGGKDITVTTASSGGVTIENGGHGPYDPAGAGPDGYGAPVGAINLTDTGSGDISITGGTTIDVAIDNVDFLGDIIIGVDVDIPRASDYDAAALPSGNIKVSSTSTKGNTVTIDGGADVTVTVVNDAVNIGEDNEAVGPTGTVDVTVAGGTGAVTIYGGGDVTVDTGSTGGVTIEDGGHGPSAVDVGAVNVTARGKAGDIAITGGTTVDVTVKNAAFNGDITIGLSQDDNDGDVEAINPTGNVTVGSNSDVGKGNTDTIYGGNDITVDVSGDTVVVGLSTTKNGDFVPSGTVDIHNLQDTTFTGLTGANKMGGSIEVYGGTEVTVHSNTGGTITIGNDLDRAASTNGDVKVYDTSSAQNGAFMMRAPGHVEDVGNVITIHGGVASNVTVEAAGASVLIGDVNGTDVHEHNPGGTIDVTETTNSHGVVQIEGGDGITVNAQGQQVRIGYNDAASGDVVVNQKSIYTGNALGSDHDLSFVSVDGGDTVTIHTTGGDVYVNQNYGTTSGTIEVHNSFSGAGTANSADIIVAGGSTVDITVDNTTSGNIAVGAAWEHFKGFGSKSLSDTFGNFATGDVTIKNAVTYNGVTTYGTSQFGVLTSGETVSVTGGGNGGPVDFSKLRAIDLNTANLIVDATLVNDLLEGPSITTPSVKTVTLDGVQGTTVIVSHDLAKLTINNSVTGRVASTVAVLNSGTILGQSYSAFDSQPAATLGLFVDGASNHDTQVIDQVHGTIDLKTTDGGHNYVAIDAVNTSKLIIENVGDLTITNSGPYGTALASGSTIAIINEGGVVDLGIVGEYGNSVGTIDGSKATGAIYAWIDGEATVFTGGAGDDILAVDTGGGHILTDLPDVPLVDGGAGYNTVVLTKTASHYNPLAAPTASYAIANDFTNFQQLALVYGTAGVYDVANFKNVIVSNGSSGSVILTKADLTETLQMSALGGEGGTVEWHFAGSTKVDVGLNLTIGYEDTTGYLGASSDTNVGTLLLNKTFIDGSGPHSDMTGATVTSLSIDSVGNGGIENDVWIVDNSATIDGHGSVTSLSVSGNNDAYINIDYSAVDHISITNSADTDVSDVALSLNGVTITAGTVVAAGGTTHVVDGSTVRIDGSNVGHIWATGATYGTGVTDEVISGAGGITYTAGAGGAGADPTGYEHVDLKTSQEAVDRIYTLDGGPGGFDNAVGGEGHREFGTRAVVDYFKVTNDTETSDILGSAYGSTVGIRVAEDGVLSYTDAGSNLAPHVSFSFSNGVMDYTGSATLNTNGPADTYDFLVNAERAMLYYYYDHSQLETVAAVQYGNSTVVLSVINTPANSNDIGAVTVAELRGVTGVTGFGEANYNDANTAAGHTILLDNNVAFQEYGGTVDGGTYDIGGLSLVTVHTSGYNTNTLNDMAAWSHVVLSGAEGDLNVHQNGANGDNSLIIDAGSNNFSSFGFNNDMGTIGVYGDHAVILTGSYNGDSHDTYIDLLSDNTGDLHDLIITGSNYWDIGEVGANNLQTIDASQSSGTISIGGEGSVDQNGLHITTGDGIFTMWSDGNDQTFNVGCGAANLHSWGDDLTVNGYAGDGIFSGGGTYVDSYGDNADITLGHAQNTVYSYGDDAVIKVGIDSRGIGEISAAGQYIYVSGQNADVDLSGGAVWSGIVVVGDTSGGGVNTGDKITLGATTGPGLETIKLDGATTGHTALAFDTPADEHLYETTIVINDHGAGLDFALHFGNAGTETWLGQVNVASATSLSQALDLAAATAALSQGSDAQIGVNTGLFDWFQFGGDTYLVEAINAGAAATHSALAATDQVVKIIGLVDLGSDYDTGTHTLSFHHAGSISFG